MTATELRNWRGKRSRTEAALILGCSERTIQNYEGSDSVPPRKIPKLFALAVAAVEAGLEPYTKEQQ
jgi:hypothetical protein